jgi:ATP-dependent DNA helicase RecG
MQPQVAKRFHQLGLTTLRDALVYFPFRHEDWRTRAQISEVAVGQEVTLEVTVTHVSARASWRRRGMTITDVTVTDESQHKLHAIWYNLPFLAKSIKVGDRLYLSGTISAGRDDRLQLTNPVYERPSETPLHATLVPVYRSTEGLSQRQIRLVMKQAVELASALPDPFEPGTCRELGLVDLVTALTNIHFPPTPDDAHAAVQRLKFDELLAWQLRVLSSVRATTAYTAPVIPFQEDAIRTFVQHLPFALTNDQRVAAWQVLQDLNSTTPMSRLVQGDVGSGKTVVAALVAYNASLAHEQVALVAPTIVLAEQHWTTLTTTLGKHDVSVGLLTGQNAKIFRAGVSTDVQRSDVINALREGTVHIAIGTHAILQPTVSWHRLGLVIVDEQQRFGVDQRQALIGERERRPHFLSLTATPIPRSFALWMTGILSISTIKQLPPGRVPIVSRVIGPDEHHQRNTAIQDRLAQHQQVYVITPFIEESDTFGARAATSEHERLIEAFPHARVGLLHGAMPAVDRVAVLDHFRQHKLDILVSTTVIEVGVDVPNATLMVIEGADRFGLSQLHQLRGRVGRGSLPSLCLFSTDRSEPAILEKLQRVASMTDGFAIAELDWQTRGGGDLYGQRQSGLPTWQLAAMTDTELFQRARTYADQLPEHEQAALLARLDTTTPSPEFHPE